MVAVNEDVDDFLSRLDVKLELVYSARCTTTNAPRSPGDEAHLRSALSQFPNYDWERLLWTKRSKALYLKGKLLYVLGDGPATARQCLEQAVKLDPRAPAPWNLLGHCYWEAGSLAAALQAFAQANGAAGNGAGAHGGAGHGAYHSATSIFATSSGSTNGVAKGPGGVGAGVSCSSGSISSGGSFSSLGSGFGAASSSYSSAGSSGANKEALRCMSQVVRQLANAEGAATTEAKLQVMELSVALAKKAVAADVVDGASWYALGLAQLAQCFALHSLNTSLSSSPSPSSSGDGASGPRAHSGSGSGRKASASWRSAGGSAEPQHSQPLSAAAAPAAAAQSDLEALRAHAAARYQSGRLMQAALNAFQQAQRCGLDQLADLYYNRAVVYLYLQEFGSAVEDFRRAGQLDPALPAAQQVRSTLQLVQQLANFVAPKQSTKAKLKGMPVVTEAHVRTLTPQRYASKSLAALAPGRNAGVALVCRLMAMIEQSANGATRYCVAIDSSGDFFVLALVGLPEWDYHGGAGAMLSLLEPIFHRVELAHEGKEFGFACIRIDDITKLLLNGLPIDTHGSAPQLQATYVAAK